MKTNDVSPSSIHDLFYEFWNEAMLFDAGNVNEVNSYEKTLNELVSFLDKHHRFDFCDNKDILVDCVESALCDIVIMGRIGEINESCAFDVFLSLCSKQLSKNIKIS